MSNDSISNQLSPLIRYLKVTDYDALELVLAEITISDHMESKFVEQVLTDWKEEQAISNLLFGPKLIPEAIRFDSIIKALDSDDAPYYVLAAVVGLQSLSIDVWTAEQKREIGQRLISIVGQNVELISARASITVWDFLEVGDDELFKLYPVEVATANRNIMAYALTRYADISKKKFKQAFKEMDIKWGVRRKFIKCFKKYLRGKKNGSAVFLQAPQYIDIPSLTDIDQRVLA